MIENELASLSAVSRRRGAAFAVGILAFTVAALVFFTEVSLSAAPIGSITLELAVTSFCLVIMYSSMADAGAQAGEELDTVRRANAEWRETASRVRASGRAPHLADFCRRLAEAERYAVRSDILAAVGLSVEAGLELFRDPPRLRREPSRTRRAVRRAASLPQLRLSPEHLLYGTAAHRRRTLLPPSAASTRRRSTVRALLPALLGSLLTVSVALGCRDGIDAAAIISASLRLLALLSGGVRGYAMGYRSVTDEGVQSTLARTEYLSEFLREAS